jgi:hypothetical protein
MLLADPQTGTRWPLSRDRLSYFDAPCDPESLAEGLQRLEASRQQPEAGDENAVKNATSLNTARLL